MISHLGDCLWSLILVSIDITMGSGNDKAAGPIFHDKKAKPKTFVSHIGLQFNLDSIARCDGEK